jgi:hypothetical protein
MTRSGRRLTVDVKGPSISWKIIVAILLTTPLALLGDCLHFLPAARYAIIELPRATAWLLTNAARCIVLLFEQTIPATSCW